MFIHEILREQALAPLYHGTNWNSALEILSDGGFLPLTAQRFNGKTIKGLSASRSPRISHMDFNPGQHHDETVINAFNVLFVLDQAKIAQHFRILPVDYFKGEKTLSIRDRDAAKLRDRRSEAEEFIAIPKKLPLHGNVSKIIYFSGSYANPDDEPSVEEFNAFKAKALRYSITVVFNRTLYDYGSYARNWDQDNRASLITHADKNEFRLSQQEFAQLSAMKQRYDAAGQPKDETAWTMFNPGEQVSLLWFWQLLNARKPLQGQTLTGPTVRAVFATLSKVDPQKLIAYRKIAPFRPAKPAPLPPKHNGGMRLPRTK